MKPTAGDLVSREDWYRSLFELSMDAMYIGTPDGHILDVNQAWLDLFGYTRTDVPTLTAQDLYANPADRHDFVSRMTRDGSVTDVVQYKRNDGTVFLCRRSQVARKDESGRVIAYQGVIHDITEHRRVEQAFADELTRRRLLIEQSRDGIVVIDEDGKVVEANPQFAQMLGYPMEEATTLHVWDWDDSLTREQLLEMLRTIDEKGDHFETRHRRKDGTIYDVEISSNGAMFSGHKLVLCVCRDITARKQAEQALRESEERYRLLAENASDVIWVYSLPERRYTYVSPAIERIFGYTPEEAMQLRPADHMPAESLEQVRRAMRAMEGSGDWKRVQATLECEQTGKDGTRFWTEISYSAMRDDDGRPHSIVGITRDISTRKRAEARLGQLNDELRHLTARLHSAREEERARVSMELHDEVGQTLSAVKMDLAMLRWNLGVPSPGQAHAMAERIDALLGECVSRLRGLETDLKPAMLEDLGLAAAIEWQMSEFALHTGVRYTISRLDDFVLFSNEASLAVFRVFQEALNNVTQHAGADAVDVSVSQDNGQVTVLIRDNGCGISNEEAAAPSSAGLVNMRERLLPLGGEVEVSGTPGEGTMVRITVPGPDEQRDPG